MLAADTVEASGTAATIASIFQQEISARAVSVVSTIPSCKPVSFGGNDGYSHIAKAGSKGCDTAQDMPRRRRLNGYWLGTVGGRYSQNLSIRDRIRHARALVCRAILHHKTPSIDATLVKLRNSKAGAA